MMREKIFYAYLWIYKLHYHRSKRPVEVEAVLGQMKANNNFTRFTLRSLEKVSIEFGLMPISHNLRKLAKRREVEQLPIATTTPNTKSFQPKNSPAFFKLSNAICSSLIDYKILQIK